MPVKIVEGDILEAKEQYICHQCNCITTYAAGLAKQIFARFPYSDDYKGRIFNEQINQYDDLLGQIRIHGDGKDYRFVINMFAQLYPGTPKFPTSAKDGSAARERYFQLCLDKISAISGLTSIAFPFKIGCNLAGGNWENYQRMIEGFSDKMHNIETIIYRKD